MKLFKLLTFSLILGLAACADQSSRSIESQLEAAGFGIQGGELVSKTTDPVTKQVKGVLAILRQDGFKPHCSGALIAPELIVTAAHCLFDEDTKDWIPVKELKIATCVDKKSEGCSWAEVKTYVIHEDYPVLDKSKGGEIRGVSSNLLQHDLAIVQLRKKNSIKGFFPLASRSPEANDLLFGYGTGTVEKGGSLDRKLRTVELSADKFDNHFKDGSSSLGRYMALHSDVRGFCHGDSGGAVFTYQNKVLVLSGLVSAGMSVTGNFACGSRGTIITDLSQYSNWIKNTSDKLIGPTLQVQNKRD